tara:strand:- start:405 stop:1346 length:942 start_codon:yes stop_codon:yes gene_type:complete
MKKDEFFSTPILITIWRRPKETNEVIKAIRKVKPKKLFIACDGPRKGNNKEFDNVQKTIELCKEKIDWDCEVKWLISKENLGCKIGVVRAINWFFENVEEGIIMEDDNVAHPDFFMFCQELLKKYKFDKRVWSISGSNNQDGIIRGDGSYYFGKTPLVWGWATWKDRWNEYDVDMKKWPDLKAKNYLDDIFKDKIEMKYWLTIFDNFYETSEPDTYDYQWVFTCLINNGLVIIPNKNLINNIGFNLDATHTKWEKTSVSKVSSIGNKLIHPKFILCDSDAERYQFDFFFGGYSTRLKNNFILRLKNKLKRILK